MIQKKEYKPRIIPCLLMHNKGFVKTVRFKEPKYLGDPVNIVRIFNDKEVDEIVVLDISTTIENREPDYETIEEIAGECFMPLAYGGGIKNLSQMEKLFKIGIEKIVLNTIAIKNPSLINDASERFGSQSIVVSIDVKKNNQGFSEVYVENGRRNTGLSPVHHAVSMERSGAGEILLNSIDRDGTREGYDIELIRQVSSAVSIPLIASGGAGCVDDFPKAVFNGGASAAAAGSLFVLHGKLRGVLIWYPPLPQIEQAFKTFSSITKKT